MPTAHYTYQWLMLAVGALSVFLGYRLFCDVAGHKLGRQSGLITSLVAGALLALFGMGILVADVRGFGASMTAQKPSWQKKSSQPRLLEKQNLKKVANRYDRFV